MPWHVARNERNLGFPGNCNVGAKHGSAPIIAFCNQDVLAVPGFSAGWDSALDAAFQAFPEMGILGPRLLFPNMSVQSVGGEFDKDCQPYHRCLGYSNPFAPEISVGKEVGWVTGAFFAIRRALFERLDGFDTTYERGYFEDVDCCLRASELGWKTRYEPSITLFHSVGSTGGNPKFMHNAQIFYARWVASRKIQPNSSRRMVEFWPPIG